jgi:hypothetical protein
MAGSQIRSTTHTPTGATIVITGVIIAITGSCRQRSFSTHPEWLQAMGYRTGFMCAAPDLIDFL